MSDHPAANADQIAYWNDSAGKRWAALQPRLDIAFAGLTGQILALAAPRPGERVLDVGCGAGATSLALAQSVAPGGSVLGVDVSAVMLARAKARAAADAPAGLSFVLADASTHALPAAGFDLIFSRFGVMFFDNPVAAFANLRRALAPAGRLAFICWRPMPESTWFQAPVAAARPYLPQSPPPDPLAPGPFAFADPDRVRSVLAEAGFARIAITPCDSRLPIGTPAAAAETAQPGRPAVARIGGGQPRTAGSRRRGGAGDAGGASRSGWRVARRCLLAGGSLRRLIGGCRAAFRAMVSPWTMC